MANPVFIASTTLLKSQLRLSGAAQPDALAMIDAAIQQGRLYLVRILGSARVLAIQGLPFVPDALTKDETTRLKANMTELALVRIYLLRTMPTMFMDASGAKREAWNDEGFARSAQKDIQAEINRLQLDIDLWLTELAADDGVAAGDAQGGVMSSPTPCHSPIQIERSIQGGYQHEQDQYNILVRGGIF